MKNKEENNQKNKTYAIYKYLFLIISTLPLVILPPFLSSPDWDKTIIFRIAMAVIIAMFLWNAFKNRMGKEIKAKIKPIKILFFLLSAIFFLFLLSTIFSQDVSFSLWGSPYRAGGFVTFSFYIFFSLLAFLIIKSEDWDQLLNWSLGIGWLVSLIAIFQSFSIFNKFLVSFSKAPPSTTGNSILLALYCLLLFFVALAFFIKTKEKGKKIFYGITALLFGFVILLTSCRAVYLGIVAGLFYFVFFYPQKGKKLRVIKIVGIAMLALVVAGVIYVNTVPELPNFIKQNRVLSNISTRLSYKLIVGESRFSGWQIMLGEVKEKPILGWGPENLQIGYDKYYNPNLPGIIKLWWDRAHNFMLEIAISSGIPALIVYILFFALLFFELQKIKKRYINSEQTTEYPILCHMVQGSFVAYFVADFFSLDSFVTYIILFLLVGYSFNLVVKEKGVIPLQDSILTPKKNKFVFYLIIFLVSIFILFFNILPFKTNLSVSRAVNLTTHKRCNEAISLMDKRINDKNFVTPYLRLKFAEMLRNCAAIDRQKSVEHIQKGFDVLQQNIKDQPKFTRLWVFLAGFTNVLIEQEQNPQKKDELLNLVEEYTNKGFEMAPKRQDLFLEKSKTYYLIKNYPAMEQNSKDCLKISEKFGGCWWYLGIAEIFQGRQEDGKIHIAQAQKLGFDPSIFQLIEAYLSQKNYKDAIPIYAQIVRDNPENANYHANLAFLYRQIGDYENAGGEAIKVFKLQPDNKEAQAFLEQLLELNPNDPNLHTSLAYIYTQIGETEKARQEYLILKSFYSQLIAKEPNRTDYHYSLALIYRELKEYEKARKEALIVLELSKDDPATVEKVNAFLDTLPY